MNGYFLLFLEITQLTTPEELPIIGDPFTEVALDLIFSSRKPAFILNGKRLQLLEPLDRDKDNLSHIVFQVRKINLKKKNKINLIRACIDGVHVTESASSDLPLGSVVLLT